MSRFDRERIEAAVRAWDLEPTEATIKAAFGALDAPRGFWTVDEKDDDAEISIYALSGWLAHVRAIDAAKPAPAVEADPLAGVVFVNAGAVLRWAEQDWSDGRKRDVKGFDEMDVCADDWNALVTWRSTQPSAWNGWAPFVFTIAAHARAQLARESAAPAPAPAMTLEQDRKSVV